MYQAQRLSRSELVPVRNLSYHVRLWGTPSQERAPLVMVHGWMDVAASWQFVVDALAHDRYVIAPDWRGYGLTGIAGPPQDADGPLRAQRSVGATYSPPTDNYWFPDYLADLDFLLDHYTCTTPVDLVGHSMGGNIAMMYAGVRPERIRRLVNLEGFGMGETQPSQAPDRYVRWIDQLKSLHKGELALKPYDDAAGVARRLMKTNPRLAQDKADWLATHWAHVNADGKWEIMGDPAHKIINAHLYQVPETLELYKCITAPTLSVEADGNSLDQWWAGKYTLAQYHERLRCVPDVRSGVITDAGHMLHHDQPEQLARMIEDFLGQEFT